MTVLYWPRGLPPSRPVSSPEAIEVLQRVVDAKPQQGSARRNLAVALYSAGRLDDAIAQVDEAARLAPGDAATQELSQQLRAARPVIR